MTTEKELRDTVQSNFRKLWDTKSFLSKRGRVLEKKEKAKTRPFGVRKALKDKMGQTEITDLVDSFLKKEVERGFTKENTSEFIIRSYPVVEVMKVNGSVVVSVSIDAAFIPEKRK